MVRLMLGLAAVTALSACSNLRDRREPATDNTARELRIAPPDTTQPSSRDLAARGTAPVSPVEQQVAPPEQSKASPRPRPRKNAAPQVPPPADTTSTRGYAPEANPDSIAVRDTASTPTRAPDTAVTATDTNPAPPPLDTSTVASSSSSPTVAAASGTDEATRTLPIGTEIHAALDDSINSRQDSAGRSVTAQVMENVTGPNGRILIAAGTPVRLTVVRLSSAKSKSSQGRLAFRVDGIQLKSGLQPVDADVRPVPHELRGRGVTGGDAAKVGAGAAGGAVLGRVLGGNTRGAVIGGVVGAAGGAVVASQTATRDVVVKAKTPVVFVLTAPLVTP